MAADVAKAAGTGPTAAWAAGARSASMRRLRSPAVGTGASTCPRSTAAEFLRDPGRFRLRTPPPGYDWVGVGRDIYLVQRGTGRVLDAIPDGF